MVKFSCDKIQNIVRYFDDYGIPYVIPWKFSCLLFQLLVITKEVVITPEPRKAFQNLESTEWFVGESVYKFYLH